MSFNDFQETEPIVLQPNSSLNLYKFYFKPAATATGKGSIPFNTNVSSVTVSGYTENGTSANDLIGATPTVTSNVVSVKLSYPSAGTGKYVLRFILTLDDSSVWEKDWTSIECVNIGY